MSAWISLWRNSTVAGASMTGEALTVGGEQTSQSA
jgi:hypothetical protein